MFNRTYGVEIEMYGNKLDATNLLSRNAIPCTNESYTHAGLDTWKTVTDGSLERSGGEFSNEY